MSTWKDCIFIFWNKVFTANLNQTLKDKFKSLAQLLSYHIFNV